MPPIGPKSLQHLAKVEGIAVLESLRRLFYGGRSEFSPLLPLTIPRFLRAAQCEQKSLPAKKIRPPRGRRTRQQIARPIQSGRVRLERIAHPQRQAATGFGG